MAPRWLLVLDIPDEINQAYIGDLLLISEAFAACLISLLS